MASFKALPRLFLALALASASPALAATTLLNATALTTQYYGNDSPWYTTRIPLFECSDTALTSVYYYRWALFRAHQRDLGSALGFISTEFLDDVSWELLPFASLNDASAFHLSEARWLRDRRFAHDYRAFLYTYHAASATYGNDRHFSEAIADAALRVAAVDGDLEALAPLRPAMQTIYEQWEADHFDASKGLYWIEPLLDATEYTISSIDASGGVDGFTGGEAFRPSINSFQYANARAIAVLAGLEGDAATEAAYAARAEAIRGNFTAALWNSSWEHFIDRYYETDEYVSYWEFIRGRELVGLTSWNWDIVPDNETYTRAWLHALDPTALRAPAGLSTVEPSYEYYMRQYRYDAVTGARECQWNGPIWPFQTTSALGGLANLLQQYTTAASVGISATDYVTLLRLYAELHANSVDGGNRLNLVEDYFPNGSALVYLHRSPHYFHSGFIDLILSGLVGIRPRIANDDDTVLEVQPLVDASIPWFRVDNVLYHGHNISIQWDVDGAHYGGDAGLVIYVDGAVANSTSSLTTTPVLLATLEPVTLPPIVAPQAKSIQWQSDTPYPVANASTWPNADTEQLHDAIDGRVWFWTDVVNGFDSAVGDGVGSQWVSVDFGAANTTTSRAEIALYEGDEPGWYTYSDGTFAAVNGSFAVPLTYGVEYLATNGSWAAVEGLVGDKPVANGITNVEWTEVEAQVVRLVFTPAAGTQVRLVEFKLF